MALALTSLALAYLGLYLYGAVLADAAGLTQLAQVVVGDVVPVEPHAVDMLPHEAAIAADHVAIVVLKVTDTARDDDPNRVDDPHRRAERRRHRGCG